MPGAEVVVGTLVPAGESAYAAGLAEGPEGLAAAGKYLMGVSLMAYVEDYLVLGGVEDVMVRYYKFHRAEAGAQVAGILGADLYDVLPQFRTELLKFFDSEAFDVGGRVYLV